MYGSYLTLGLDAADSGLFGEVLACCCVEDAT